MPRQQVTFPTRSEVDFVVIGSGAAGGVIAKELSTSGYDVVVLEQGPWVRENQFKHDELDHGWVGRSQEQDPQGFRQTEADEVEARSAAGYLPVVGGTSVHFTANYWRFHEVDFVERSLLGPIAGTGFADWPITYQDLEPYYTKVEWEVGVSGAPGPHDPPRSRPFPVPPLPVKSSGVLLERAAAKLGWHAFPAPMAILSRPLNGRGPCQHCGWCMGFGCEFGAKSSSLAAMIPLAQASGRCEIRTESTVHRIATDAAGRVSEVVYFDREGNEQAQRAKAVVLSANGAETPRLLLMSSSSRFPDGLANSSGKVGKYLMGNGQVHCYARFPHPLNEQKSVQVTRVIWDFYRSDPSRGFYGGGGMDARFQFNPIGFGLRGLPSHAPEWGAEYKRMLGEYFNYTIDVNGHSTNLPLESNNITLSPTLKDRFGRPGLVMTYKDHPDDLSIQEFFLERCHEIVAAMDPLEVWDRPVRETRGTVHLLGTCRMGNDPNESVVDKYHRAHDVRNLFICDGSSLVSSGRGQPTMTIQALAFRAAEHIGEFASRGEI
jgi:choline dehydrogenase-like flavoprotein